MTHKPFDYIASINVSKENLIVDDASEKGYEPFLTNRNFSLFPETVMYANEMNKLYQLDKKLQYDFYLYGIPKRKRFAKWPKKQADENLKAVMEFYKYNVDKARAALRILTDDQLKEIKDLLEINN